MVEKWQMLEEASADVGETSVPSSWLMEIPPEKRIVRNAGAFPLRATSVTTYAFSFLFYSAIYLAQACLIRVARTLQLNEDVLLLHVLNAIAESRSAIASPLATFAVHEM